MSYKDICPLDEIYSHESYRQDLVDKTVHIRKVDSMEARRGQISRVRFSECGNWMAIKVVFHHTRSLNSRKPREWKRMEGEESFLISLGTRIRLGSDFIFHTSRHHFVIEGGGIQVLADRKERRERARTSRAYSL